MAGQEIAVPAASYFSLQMLVAAEGDGSSRNLTFKYADGTSSLAEVRTNPYTTYLSILKGEIVMPSYFTNNGTNFNTTNIFEYFGSLDSLFCHLAEHIQSFFQKSSILDVTAEGEWGPSPISQTNPEAQQRSSDSGGCSKQRWD